MSPKPKPRIGPLGQVAFVLIVGGVVWLVMALSGYFGHR
jgi:hypothetical protein